MDCSTCYYPNEDEARFCIRCAAALGVPVSRLPTEPPAAPSPEVTELIAGSGDLGSPQLLAQALEGSNPRRTQGFGTGQGRAPSGQTLLGGRYRLLSCLGSGGFGAVYEAEEVSLGLRVAIKLLNRSALQDARMRQRFLQEARMIAELRSPHIVVLHDYAVTDSGVPYLVMELLSGKPLSHDMMIGVLPARRAVHIMAQVCGALGDAHACGMVHRDIKPDNVLLLAHAPPFSPNLPPSPTLAERDFVKVVDFGVARWCGSSTRASDILGTPAYISPETLADEPVDGRSDLYAVGMLLWQMIVGELPFPSKNQAQMMKSHLDATRYRPRDINSRYRLPDALEDLMVKLIARAPSDRPSSAYEVRSQLHDLLAQPGLLPERPLRGASRPDFGPHWDGPARTTSPHQREVDQSAITVKMPTRIDTT